MSILVDSETKVLIQGITGKQGSRHCKLMKEYGTKIITGVTPGKKGESVHKVPVFNSVEEAQSFKKAGWSVCFVPARHAKDAALEALQNGLNLVIITEDMPIHDTLYIRKAANKKGLHMIGPNTPGICSPGKSKLGVIPNKLFKKGDVGIICRSGSLIFEITYRLTKEGIGQSTVVGIGGDNIIGSDFEKILSLFEDDKQTKKVVLIGEIGGKQEERASNFIKQMEKPVVAHIVGKSAPPGKRMGHAGAIIQRGTGTATSKIRALKKAGAAVAKFPGQIPKILKDL